MTTNALSLAAWMTGDARSVGRELMQHLPAAKRVARAQAVLEICASQFGLIAEVDRVLRLSREPSRWAAAHDAFYAVRGLALREERAPTSKSYAALLSVAETVAKTIYNASEQPAPFDHDAPWKLSERARMLLHTLQDDERLAQRLWSALTGT